MVLAVDQGAIDGATDGSESNRRSNGYCKLLIFGSG